MFARQRYIQPEIVMWDALQSGDVPLRLLARPQESPFEPRPIKYSWGDSRIYVAAAGRSFSGVVQKFIESGAQPTRTEEHLMMWPLVPLADGRLDDGAIETTLDARLTPPQSDVLLQDAEGCFCFILPRDRSVLVADEYPASVAVFDPMTGAKLREQSVEPD